MQSLRGRLIVLIALLCAAGAAAGALMVGLFNQSASAQAGQAAAESARACDAIVAAYRFYSTDWRGPDASLKDPSLRSALTTVVQSALRGRVGIEGGIWQGQAGSLAYAYPTYQGGQPKTDFPQAEVSRIDAISSVALRGDRLAHATYPSSTEVLLLAACPLTGPIPQLTAWTMMRVVTFAGRAYQQLMTGLAVLLVTVIIAATFLIRTTLIWSRHVRSIENTLDASDVDRLPTIERTGEKELDQIVAALNVAGTRLTEERSRADQLAIQVANSDRLAAIGRVAAGVAHEIRNPIAAMRLKAENALLGDVTRKDQSLSMILGQIERLDRLLRRLLSLTEQDPPRRIATDVKALTHSAMQDHEEVASTHGVSLICSSESFTARLDTEQIRRALGNLILNGIQAAPESSIVEISARIQGELLILQVHDEGAGPAPALREHLFEPFVTGRADGTGLGLSVVREIANAHGGSAKLADCTHGTTFEISLPWQ